MDKDKSIIDRIENYTDEIRKYCNGMESIIKLEITDTFELNFKKIHYDITQELNKYYRKSRNDKQNVVLPKLKDILSDLIYEFENRTLIQEYLFKDLISGNKEFLNEKYLFCEPIREAIVDLYDHLEIEIEQREKRTDSHGRIDSRIDSSHCIDINTRYVIALFEEILKNAQEIRFLSNHKKSILLEKLSGHKRKTFANNYSKYGARSGEDYIYEAKTLINTLLE